MPEPTLFDKIIRGQIPSHKVFENDAVYALLDIAPVSRGHTLVIPKESTPFLHELSDESAAAIGRVLPRLARAVMKATGTSAYNLLQNNGAEAHQAVFHVHFHIIPRYPDQGLGLVWEPQSLSPEQGQQLAASIAAAVGSGG